MSAILFARDQMCVLDSLHAFERSANGETNDASSVFVTILFGFKGLMMTGQRENGRYDPKDRTSQAVEMQRTLNESSARRAAETLNGCDAFVCFLDVDGFREELYRNDQGLYDDYVRFVERARDDLWAGWIGASGGEDTLEDPDRLLYPYLFSDSWLFVTTDASDESFRQICHAAAILWVRAMFLNKFLGPPEEGPGLIGRGAIARGPVWWNPSQQITLGKPIAEAYHLAESMQCYGVAIHASAESRDELPTTRVLRRTFGSVISLKNEVSVSRALEPVQDGFHRSSEFSRAFKSLKTDTGEARHPRSTCYGDIEKQKKYYLPSLSSGQRAAVRAHIQQFHYDKFSPALSVGNPSSVVGVSSPTRRRPLVWNLPL